MSRPNGCKAAISGREQRSDERSFCCVEFLGCTNRRYRDARRIERCRQRAGNRHASLAPCWARRSFAAATIFIALVIFCVDLTEPMRSLRVSAIRFQANASRTGRSASLSWGGVVVERLGVADLGQDLGLSERRKLSIAAS